MVIFVGKTVGETSKTNAAAQRGPGLKRDLMYHITDLVTLV